MNRFPVSITEKVAEIHLPDLGLLSRHDIDVAIELRDAVYDTADEDDVKAIVFIGDHPFCARGANGTSSMDTHDSYTRGYEAFVGGAGVFQQITYCKKVTIAAVSGECADAGCLIALCSDFTVAAEDAIFWPPFATMPEANFALATFVMRLNRTTAWSLRNRGLTAAEALDQGLINEVVPVDRLHARAVEIAREVAKRPLDGITVSKLAFQTFLDSRGVDKDFEIGALAAQAGSLRSRAGDVQ